MNIPNTLTLGRIVLVPLVVWLIITHEMQAAFLLFLLAGLSDAADGFLAKRYGWDSELGAYLDPIADKALLVSIYVTLGFAGHLPVWLVIAVVSRDILIVGAVVLSWMLSRPLSMQPLLISKANTFVADRACRPGAGRARAWAGFAWADHRFDLGDRHAHDRFGRRLFLAVARAHGELRAHARAASSSPKEGGRPRPSAELAGQGFVTLAQLTLDLPHRAALGAEDFLVSECNLAAVRLINSWPQWQDHVQLLVGPPASGKTHLARVWQALSGARALDPGNLGIHSLDAMKAGTPLVVEDVDRRAYDEKALFHLLNLARENRLFVLLTAQSAPSRWGIKLPDLLSRLNAVPTVEIGVPDEALLQTVMLKQFADRQLDIDPKVLTYLALHVDRSLAAAAAAVAAVDRVALATGRKINRQLVVEVLAANAVTD